MPLHADLTDKDFDFNASLDPMLALEKMGFLPRSIYREGNLIRVHCPVHKDLVRKSLIIDAGEKTFKCQFSRCPAQEGGLLIELVALYFQCPPSEVPEKLFSQPRAPKDLVFRGEMLINQGRPADALPYFERAVAQNPRDEITRCKLAALYLELDQKDDAYQEYLRAAESYAVRGELEKTLSIYNILIMLQPGAVKARKQLAFLFSRLGRPDAASEQMKWVIDFYCHYDQVKAAVEACEQLLEADPDSAMTRRILGRLYQQVNKRVQGVQEFEHAARLFIGLRNREEALETIEEAVGVAPGNPRLRELRVQAESLAPSATARPVGLAEDSVAAEQAFHQWLADVDERLDFGAEGALGAMEGALGDLDEAAPAVSSLPSAAHFAPVAPPSASSDFDELDIPAPPKKSSEPPSSRKPRPAYETAEILPTDHRVEMCLADLKGLTRDQVEEMREQLIMMFNDARRNYEEGLVADWELRAIKEFYKAFNLAVDRHLHQSPESTPPPAPAQ